MRRKDGKTKRKAIRAMPEFQHGFGENPHTAAYRNPQIGGKPLGDSMSVVSMFCGCGGLDLGFLGGFEVLGRRFDNLPFRVELAVDNSEDAVEAYRLNLGAHVRNLDLAATPPEELPAADVLLGGFPCQDFSSCGSKTGLNGKRGKLYRALVDYMALHRPRVVVGENVPHLAKLNQGRNLEIILADLEEVGYRFVVWELYAPDFGLPQSRRRLFLVGVRDDIQGFPVCPKPTHLGKHVSIDVALADLEGIADETLPNQSQYFVAIKATSGGGQGDHANERGKVGYCIRANSRGRIQFHYLHDRRLTVRECARLQSFPDEFVFPFSTQRNMMLIGNAVPPLLGHSVASAIDSFLSKGVSEPSSSAVYAPKQMSFFS